MIKMILMQMVIIYFPTTNTTTSACEEWGEKPVAVGEWHDDRCCCGRWIRRCEEQEATLAVGLGNED